jgi:hypothetical protein
VIAFYCHSPFVLSSPATSRALLFRHTCPILFYIDLQLFIALDGDDVDHSSIADIAENLVALFKQPRARDQL